jgi:hypothetical protein
MAEDKAEGQAEGQGAKQTDIEALKAELRAEVKAEIIGLNRKISELENKAKAEFERGLSEGEQKGKMTEGEKMAARIAELEEKSRRSEEAARKMQRESAIKDLADKHKVKKSVLDIALNSTLEIEDIDKNFAEVARSFQDDVVADANRQIAGKAHKPGSGNVGESGKAPAFDPYDMSEANLLKAAEWREKQKG